MMIILPTIMTLTTCAAAMLLLNHNGKINSSNNSSNRNNKAVTYSDTRRNYHLHHNIAMPSSFCHCRRDSIQGIRLLAVSPESSSSSSSASSSRSDIDDETRRVVDLNNGKEQATAPTPTTTTAATPNVAARTRQTWVDAYFQKHQCLPKPKVIHATLPVDDSDDDNRDGHDDNRRGRILVIGDVHGCYEELVLLHQKAVDEENNGQPFRHVILVGDLCNKGPHSARVIRHVRNMAPHGWLAIRGNHDDAALKAALGNDDDDVDGHRYKAKFAWVTKGERSLECKETGDDDDSIVLSDDDVLWMADLPYMIRIPRELLQQDEVDTVIVHAGLIPGVALEAQSINDMIKLREVVRKLAHDDDDEKKGTVSYYSYTAHADGSNQQHDEADESTTEQHNKKPVAWASQWHGPFRVIFGHDARRGLQRYNDDYAVGLDTGAVYGKQLTGMILPSRKLVSVNAIKTHCPITSSAKNDDNNKGDI